MNNSYAPASAGDVVIPVNTHLKRLPYVVVGYYLVVAAVLGWWFGRDPTRAGWLTWPMVWFVYGLLFAGTLLLSQVNRHKKVVFSTRGQAVYSQSYFGKKQLMAFADIGAIKPYSSGYGITYFALFGRDNLFQRNPPRISPNYTAAKKSSALYHEFEQTIVPELRALVGGSRPDQHSRQPAPIPVGPTYYNEESGGYELKNTYNRTPIDKAIPIGLFAVSAFVLFNPSLRGHLFGWGVGIGLAGCLMTFLLTETKRFRDGQLILEYQWGWLRNRYPVSQFSTYQITHRNYNFVYVGTDVNLIFMMNNKPKAIFLCRVRKTEKIDALIAETNAIIDTMRQR